jgi:ubiquinone biosynthesis protein UbiJ
MTWITTGDGSNSSKEEIMADQNHLPSKEEITLMLKRSSLALPPEQLEKCCAVVARLEAAAGRLRKDLKRADEPASVFRAEK